MATTNRFLGDSPLRILVKLVVISFLVGVVMSTFGWSPYDIVGQIRDFVLNVWHMGFSSIERVGNYILLGAAIVIPAFVILRLVSYRR